MAQNISAGTNMPCRNTNRIVRLLGYDAKPPTPGSTICPDPAPTSASQDLSTNSTIPRWTRSFQVAKHHQSQHQGQADAEAILLRLLSQRFTANRLGSA